MKRFKLPVIRFRQPAAFGLVVALLFSALAVSASLNSCAALKDLAGLSRVQFKLNDVGTVRLAGIDVANKHSISDFNVMDGLNLLNAFNSGKFPLTFTLNVAAKNPNPPSGNTALNSLQVSDFPWHLLLNNHETISGNIGSPFGVPAGGQQMMIPIQVSLDLKQFFQNQSYNDLINLALTLAGQGGASQVQLKAKPTLSTPLGSMKYPGELTIVSTEFRS